LKWDLDKFFAREVSARSEGNHHPAEVFFPPTSEPDGWAPNFSDEPFSTMNESLPTPTTLSTPAPYETPIQQPPPAISQLLESQISEAVEKSEEIAEKPEVSKIFFILAAFFSIVDICLIVLWLLSRNARLISPLP
jgi:hypothetical protein